MEAIKGVTMDINICPQCHGGGRKVTWPFCSEYCEQRYYDNAPIELIDKLHKEINESKRENQTND